jgi:hypothetical protein
MIFWNSVFSDMSVVEFVSRSDAGAAERLRERCLRVIRGEQYRMSDGGRARRSSRRRRIPPAQRRKV